MAVIAMLSAKAAPGVTTGVAVLSSVWPGPVVVVDADPAGGDLARGWLGSSMATGRLWGGLGLREFATTTRQSGEGSAGMLVDHLQPLPDVRGGRVLLGLTGPEQARQVGMADWRRLAESASALSREASGEVDVLVDCGRFGPATPWPLLTMADLVLLAVRPQRRHLYAAKDAITGLRALVDGNRLGLAVCGTTPHAEVNVRGNLGLLIGLRLPDDPRAARVFSDGAVRPARLHRAALVRSAAEEARRLSHVLNPSPCAPRAASVPDDLMTVGARPARHPRGTPEPHRFSE